MFLHTLLNSGQANQQGTIAFTWRVVDRATIAQFGLFTKSFRSSHCSRWVPETSFASLSCWPSLSTLFSPLMHNTTPSQVSTPVLILREHDRRGAIFWTCKMMLQHGKLSLLLLGSIDSDSIQVALYPGSDCLAKYGWKWYAFVLPSCWYPWSAIYPMEQRLCSSWMAMGWLLYSW